MNLQPLAVGQVKELVFSEPSVRLIYGKVSTGTGELDRQLLSLGKPRAWEEIIT